MSQIQNKIQNLSKYQTELRNRLDSPVPPKHAHRPEAFRLFLTRELSAVTTKLEALRLVGGGK